MKHLDTLLDELQHPVDIVQAWCDEDKDRAIVAAIQDLASSKEVTLFEVISEAFPDLTAIGVIDRLLEINDEMNMAAEEDEKPDIDYEKLYSPLEHIINDRIDLYNRS